MPTTENLAVRQEREAAAAAFATWYVAGPLEDQGLFVERLGSELTVTVDGRTYRVQVTTADPPR
jgi:hypothetical protein